MTRPPGPSYDYGCISCGRRGKPPFVHLENKDGSRVKACEPCAAQRDKTRYPKVVKK